ncbi:MAG: hypothetical protein KTR13_02755 [Saprospiraceae bacterium]|nr:hypothetical protein [Saprospiraceae bacterium]
MKSLPYLIPFLGLFACTTGNQDTGDTDGLLGLDTGISVTFVNALDDYPVQIFVEDGAGKEQYIKTIAANTSYEAEGVSPETIFYFKPKGNSNYEILPYTVDTINQQRYELALAQKRYGEAKNVYKRITNAMANRYSFDIVKIDPFKIDADEARGGGRKRLIFEELSDFDRDWYPFDGDFAVKQQFDVQFINEGKSTEKSELFKSMSTFQDEFSLSIKAGASTGVKAKKVKGTASASWSKLTNDSRANSSFFSWFRKEDSKYFIQLRPEYAQLDKGFKAAIAALPVPESLPTSLDKAVTLGVFDDYYQFVKDWGTHYPTKVTYGGIIQGSLEVTGNQVSSMVQRGFGVKQGLEGTIKGVNLKSEVGYSEEQMSELEQITESSSKEYVYKGGEGYFELWAVGDEVQPIYIDLQPLHSLLQQQFLPEGQQLVAKSKLLEFAIERYLEEFPIPNAEENNLIAYEMECTGITFPKLLDIDKPYFTLDRTRVSMWPSLNKKMVGKGTRYIHNSNGVVWEVLKGKEEVRVPDESRKRAGNDETLEKWSTPLQQPTMIFLLDPKQITKAERDAITLRFYARYEEDDGWDKKDDACTGGTYTGLNLKDVGTAWKYYTLTSKEPGKTLKKSDVTANTHFRIRKFELFE